MKIYLGGINKFSHFPDIEGNKVTSNGNEAGLQCSEPEARSPLAGDGGLQLSEGCSGQVSTNLGHSRRSEE